MNKEKKVQQWESELFGSLTTIKGKDGISVFFIGKEVAEKLGYQNTAETIGKFVDDEDKYKLDSETLLSYGIKSGQRGETIITESGLYSLIMSSKLPSAKEFKKWVTGYVLPSIRKNGAYMTNDVLNMIRTEPVDVIRAFADRLDEERKRAELAEENLALVIHSPKTFTITTVAKEIGMSAQALNKSMIEDKILYRRGQDLVPYARYQDKELFSIKSVILQHTGQAHHTTRFTSKGRVFILDKYKHLITK
jgi:anti-repressor protein